MELDRSKEDEQRPSEENSLLETLESGQPTPHDMNVKVGEFSDKEPKKFDPLVFEKAPVVLTFKGLTVSTANDPDTLLIKNVSGCINGGLWGIMGSSGSGKTTLLSILSRRIDSIGFKWTGEACLNGKPYCNATLKNMSAYVMQDDLLYPALTIADTLYYTAELRMPAEATADEKSKRVDEVMKMMGISHCHNTIVGDSRKKGLSGGERKRLCVAMELLVKPQLLFLDEVTSGLDSTTAMDVMTSLKHLATSGECTIICSIHQPQEAIFDLLDNLILMQRGSILYHGNREHSLEYFAMQGRICGSKQNPADFLIDQISSGTNSMNRTNTKISSTNVSVDLTYGSAKPDFSVINRPHWLIQVWNLFKRGALISIRRWDVLAMALLMTSIVAIFISCGDWYQVGTSQSALKKINPLLFFMVLGQGIISSFQGLYAFPMDRALMLRERAAGTYAVSAYFTAKVAVDFIFKDLPMPIVYCAWIYPLTGLHPGADRFFICMIIVVLTSICATSLSNMLSCIFISVELTSITLSVALEISRLYGGFLIAPVNTSELNMFWRFFDASSYLKYGYVGLALNQYEGETFHCTADQFEMNSSGEMVCPVTSGQQIIDKFGYDKYTIGFCIGILIVYIVVCKIVSYVFLRLVKF